MKTFMTRLSKYYDELKWLYCELYEDQMPNFDKFCNYMEKAYEKRNEALKQLDAEREADPTWYKSNKLLGMMMYVDNFAGNLQGVREKLDYIEESGVNYLHLMPLLDTPEGRSDGGYAVADFRKVRPDLGTMEDLAELCADCHKKGISVCLDFVMNHTSEDHKWAMKAKAGVKDYQDRYFFYDDFSVPALFEATVPQVFPTTAPGNFTLNPETGKYVMTTFYPYQWDLNYGNPVVFNKMVDNMLYLANQGIDIIRIDAVPYIWKQLGTNCRNLPQVHNIVRMMRMVCEIVCPGVLLLGEVVMEPDKIVPYFGSTEKPECHMLYNVTTMATTWHTVATEDTRLLRKQMDIVNRLPKQYVFQNYLRCHDDIGWGLDYPYLEQYYIQEVPHKKFLSDFFTGEFPGSFAAGELYNSDPTSGDARQCGTTASLCGVEKANAAGDKEALEKAIRYDLALHTYMLTQSGIPVIYSGDEIGQENDYSYHEDPLKCEDSRYLHRGVFSWEMAELRHDANTIPGKMFQGIRKLSDLRKNYSVFGGDADVYTIDTWDDAVLGVVRRNSKEQVTALVNFSGEPKDIWLGGNETYLELISGERVPGEVIHLEAFEAKWLWERRVEWR